MSTRQVLAVFSLLAVCAFSGCDDETVVVGVDCIANACDASDASVIKKCVNGQFQEGKCADGEVCVEDVKKGAMCQPKQSDPADKCEPEQKKCDGDKIATCGADKAWGESIDCEKPGEVCILNAEGKAACQPKQPDPSGQCDPAQTKCDGDKIATCGADKAWGESIDCERPGEVCILNAEGKALCQPKQPDPDGKCVPDKTKCEGDKIATCGADEKWGVAVKCEGENEVCQTIDGIDKCAPKHECVAQQTKCDGELVVNCSESGMWGEAEPCPHGQTCKKDGDDEKCAEKDKECEAGQIKCFESGSSLPTNLFYACDGKYWAAAPSSCEDGKICQVDNGVSDCKAATGPIEMCTKDAILCIDPDKTADYKKCVETTGGGTHWSETTEQCADNQLCFSIEGTDKCAVCKPGTSKCDGTLNGFQECSNGGAAWGRVIDCGDENAPVCAEVSSGVAKCVACENDKMRCKMAKTPQVEKCVDHEWQQHELCAGRVCLDGTETTQPKCVDCKGDQKRCNGTVIQTCDNNTWKDGKDCKTEGKVCDYSTFECVDKCTDGEAKCDDSGAFFICKSNTWVKKTDCGAKDKCIDKVPGNDKTKLGCKCDKDAKSCDASNDNVLICKEMNEGSVAYMSLDVSEECAKGMCANAIESVPGKPSMAYCKCNDGAFECKDSSDYRYCKDGKWEDGGCHKQSRCDADLRTCNTQCGPLVSQDAGSCSGWNRLTCKDSKDGKLVLAEVCTNGCQYRTSSVVTPPVVPMDLTPRIASGDRGRCIEIAVAGTKRCSKDLSAVESYSLSVGGPPTGKWLSAPCGQGQVCMWKKSSDLTHSTSETPQCVALECQEGTYKCSDKEKPGIMQCINNKWELIGNCAAGLKCQSEKISYRPMTCS